MQATLIINILDNKTYVLNKQKKFLLHRLLNCMGTCKNIMLCSIHGDLRNVKSARQLLYERTL